MGLADEAKEAENQGVGGSDKGIFRANLQNAKMFSHKATYMDDILLRKIYAICCAKNCVMSRNRLSQNNGAASEENYQASETRRLDPSKCERVARTIR